MADIRIKDLPTTATQTASDDFIALDGTVNGTRKIDASAPSFKTSVTSPSIVAPAATALTLAGGSSGASLVLGHGTTAGDATITPTGSGNIVTTSSRNGALKHALTNANGGTGAYVAMDLSNGSDVGVLYQFGTAWTTSGRFIQRSTLLDSSAVGGLTFAASGGTPIRFWSGAELARFAPTTGNLLIGTTTDAASLSGGLVVNGSGVGATASSTTTGALRVIGGVGVSGAMNVGGAVTAAGIILSANTALFSADAALSSYSTTNGVYLNGHAAGWLRLSGSGAGVAQIQLNGGATGAITMNTATANALVLNGTTGAATFAGAVAVGGSATTRGFAVQTSQGGYSQIGNINSGLERSLVIANARVANYDDTMIARNLVPVASSDSMQTLVSAPYAAQIFRYDGMIDFVNSSTSTAGASITPTLRMRISNNGDVAVTSATPSTLSTNGAFQVSGGIGVGGPSVFGGSTTVSPGASVSSSRGVTYAHQLTGTDGVAAAGLMFSSTNTNPVGLLSFAPNTGTLTWAARSAAGNLSGNDLFSVAATGAATFAGNVTTNGALFTQSAGLPELRISDTTGVGTFGQTFYAGSTYEASVKYATNLGVMTIDAGRNAAWGSKIDLYVDTTRSVRFAKNLTTFDQPATFAGAVTSTSATGGIGYGTGAGGTVTQITSRGTGVTLNKVCGQITTATNSLATGTFAVFTVTNSTVAATDVVDISIKGGLTSYDTTVTVAGVSAGSFIVLVYNRSTTTAEVGAIVFNFAVIKAVSS